MASARKLLQLAFGLMALLLAGRCCAQERFFPADAVVDVTRPPYNAVPDDNQDDTAAIQLAITENCDSGRTLYFPDGIYDIRQTLTSRNRQGQWRPRLVLQGQSRQKTIIRLKNAADGFADSSHPKAMLMTGSHFQPGDSEDGGGNKAFGNYIFDMAFDSGRGNPGAVAVEYAASNYGALANVAIRSADGAGVAGVSMRRRIPGPALLTKLTVDGFDVAVDIGDIQSLLSG